MSELKNKNSDPYEIIIVNTKKLSSNIKESIWHNFDGGFGVIDGNDVCDGMVKISLGKFY